MTGLKSNKGSPLAALTGVLMIGVLLMASCQRSNNLVGVMDRVQVHTDTMTVYTIKLTGVNIQPISKTETDSGLVFSWSDTLQNQIKFEIIPQYVVIDSTQITKRSMVEQTSYEVINPVSASNSTPSFYFNKPIRFRGRQIGAGRNFLADSLLQNNIDFPRRLHPEGRGQVSVDQSSFLIPSRVYKVTAAWKTKKGNVFIDSTRVFINLQ